LWRGRQVHTDNRGHMDQNSVPLPVYRYTSYVPLKIKISPGAPNLPIEIEPKSPFDTTISTPANASRIPKVFTRPNPSFKSSQPSNAMKTGVVATMKTQQCKVSPFPSLR
jgi:hypothetical protein